LLVALDQVYRRLVDDFDAVATQWSALCDTLGRHVVLTVGSRRLEGQAHALDGDGALLVRKENGQMERVTGADAVVERG
jgi:BirA family biotin operon repressor/biotin-[acetyl-CoA-carboxylase] ligase